jgi:pimeloyl-ACP methyl ester carboxylesterase
MGARVITYDRPGYGQSSRHPGRRVVDCVADVTAIVDDLGVDRFAVTGGSGGGPHALAVAARLPDRVIRAECTVGGAPREAEGLDWYTGMVAENVEEFGWAEQGEEVLQRELERWAAADLAHLDEDPAKPLWDEVQWADADRQVLAIPAVQRMMVEMLREAYRPGVWGWVDDDLAFVQPWGFDLAEIRVPVTIRYGKADVLVPAAHGAWLAKHVPGATVIVSETGHLADPDARLAALRELLAPDSPPSQTAPGQ